MTQPTALSLPSLLTALLLGFMLGGCASSDFRRDEWAGKVPQLKAGLSREIVRGLFGEPAETRPSGATPTQATVWIYRQRRLINSTQKITGTENRLYVDPITGQERTVPEPVYTQVNDYADEELRLTWIDNQLLSWKRTRRGESDFD